MELRHLRHFLVLAQIKNFNQAANKLNLAQPSLSRSIQRMEELLGVQLLERHARGVELTRFGELVQSRGSQIVVELECLNREIRSLKGVNRGELVIGASPIPSAHMLGPVVGRFISQYPNVNVELKIDGWRKLRERLHLGGLSFFIAETQITGLDQDPDLGIIPLPPFQVVFCARPQHPLLARMGLGSADLGRGGLSLSLSSLADYPLAVPRELPEHVAGLFGNLFSQELREQAGLLRFDQFGSIKSSLAACDLIALTPELGITEELKSGSLQILPVIDMPVIKANFSVVYCRRRGLDELAAAFVHSLEASLIHERH
ncbi:LysR family transcriptional regulator [Shewanella zhangzhouensis]|uniref:LysR family transcriptional regulator n=1 Tax=Shewanella zhangzhouensis TaxID=2864213 RepID=UPI001C65E72D|nr:LysR family transcriptional regulator [Shewanella zhangzhouensis]QYK04272.1 LysR family transcriptional regulator [Shewanella zhangzhouensis]